MLRLMKRNALSYLLMSFTITALLMFGHIFLLFCGNLSFIIGAFLYVFIFKFGAFKFLKIGWLIMVSIMILPFLLVEIDLPKSTLRTEGLILKLSGIVAP